MNRAALRRRHGGGGGEPRLDLVHGGRAPSVDLGVYTIDWVDWWQVLLGAGFVAVTLLAPGGLVGRAEPERRSGGKRGQP